MGEKQRNVPRLRFPGFTDAWEQRKAGQIFESICIRNHEHLPVLSASQELGMVYREAIDINIIHDVNNERAYKKVSKGQFVIHLRSFQGGFAYSNLEGITSPAYTILDFFNKGEHDSIYWKYYLTSDRFIELLKLITYGIRDGRSIRYKDFVTLTLTYPNREEQSRIGRGIESIDNLIARHQRKLENLKLKKKALLQKLFPRDGSQFPELRFPGFTEAWEQRKLGDIGDTYGGLTGKNKDDFGKGEALYIPYLNVFRNEFVDINHLEPIEVDEKQNCVKRGDILFTGSSEIPEEVGMSAVMLKEVDNLYLNSFCFGFRLNRHIDLIFMSYLLRSPYVRQQIKLLAQGISRFNISKQKLMHIQISFPTQDEQEQIGNMLYTLDNLIARHQQKLENLRMKKKALLQQLFV